MEGKAQQSRNDQYTHGEINSVFVLLMYEAPSYEESHTYQKPDR